MTLGIRKNEERMWKGEKCNIEFEKGEDDEGIILNEEEKSVIYLVIMKPHYM